jgi:uncharacterized membrane protein
MGGALVPMILSFFLPGIGQAYITKKWVLGLAFFVGLIIVNVALGIFLGMLGSLVSLLIWLFSMYETYKLAEGKGYKSPIFG